MDPSSYFEPKANCLLAALPADDYDAVIRVAKLEKLQLHRKLWEQGQPETAVYFPLTGAVSLLGRNGSKPHMEVATIGREGVIGAAEAMVAQESLGHNLVLTPGLAVRIDGNLFRDIAQARPSVSRLVHRYTVALMRQVLCGAACYRIHSMEERCARWFLMIHDRAGEETLPVTQEFLSHMLGVRRATVNAATGLLKKAGFIHYVRGEIRIVDRPGLEAAACECYAAIVRSNARILSDKTASP